MREILFRGKTVCNGDWVYGGITWNPSRNKVFIHTKSDECEVIPETVGQYTGLKDKKGTRIFQKDVVRIYYPFDDPNDCVISWSKEGARWDFGSCDAYFCMPSKNCEVIGNIFDNSLEGEK